MCTPLLAGRQAGPLFHATTRPCGPWLWFLTRTANYRIFQEKTVPDILKEMFDEHSAIANVEFELTETYTQWTYCVQYRETDFDFVSRLMEHEGIYYYFRHTDGKHTLVIADSYSAHAPCYEEEVPFIPPHERDPSGAGARERVVGHARGAAGQVRARIDYDFEKPSVDLQVRSSIKREHALAEYEVFEYGGDYVERGDGELYARMRIEEVQAKFERTRGHDQRPGDGSGVPLQARPSTPRRSEHRVSRRLGGVRDASGEHEAIDDAGRGCTTCRFAALNSKQPFRAERITPKPVVQGPQTALVVGPRERFTPTTTGGSRCTSTGIAGASATTRARAGFACRRTGAARAGAGCSSRTSGRR